MTDVSIIPLIFTTHCLSTCFFCFNGGIKQGGSNNWFILQAHMQALKPTKRLLQYQCNSSLCNSRSKDATTWSLWLKQSNVGAYPCPKTSLLCLFVRIASLVETQYLVSAIRQFSSEVECPANGLLMFSTVFSLEKNRTIQTHSMKKVCRWISVNLCHIWNGIKMDLKCPVIPLVQGVW